MTLLAIFFMIYGFFGHYFDGLLNHRGLDLTGLVDLLFLSPDGIFGVAIGVSADYVFLDMFLASLVMIAPDMMTDILGIAAFIVLIVVQYTKHKKQISQKKQEISESFN